TYFGFVFQGITNYTYSGTEIPLSTYVIDNDSFFFRTKKAWAVYADATVDVTDRLSINVGGRYSKENQDVIGRRFGRGGEGVGPLLYGPETGADKSSSYSKFTPRASIRYEIT